jgi:hypothetical protein
LSLEFITLEARANQNHYRVTEAKTIAALPSEVKW